MSADLLGQLARRCFTCKHPALAAPAVLALKLLAFCWLITGHAFYVTHSGAGFLPWLETAGQLRWLLLVAQLGGVALILLTGRVRTGCALLAAGIITMTLLHRSYFAYNRLFCALFLLVAALQVPGRGMEQLRAQIAVLYVSAGLDKLCEADWRSGAVLKSVFRGLGEFGSPWSPASMHGPRSWLLDAYQAGLGTHDAEVACVLSWAVMLGEVTLGVLCITRPRAAAWVNAAFQASIALVLGSTFGMFVYALLCATFVLCDWEDRVVIVADREGRGWNMLRKVLAAGDPDRRLRWRRAARGTRPAPQAMLAAAASHPGLMFALAALMAGPWMRPEMPAIVVGAAAIASLWGRDRVAVSQS